MSQSPIPRLRLKVSLEAASDAIEFARYITDGAGRNLLHAHPGACVIERVGGRKFVANRLECGGVCIKERSQKPREEGIKAAHGWGEIYDQPKSGEA